MNRPSRPSRAGLQGSSRNTALLAGGGTLFVLKAAPDSTTSTSLTWQEAVPKPSDYRIERSLDGTTFSTVTTVANSVVDYIDTGLTESTQYWYRIVPILGGADQPASNVANTWTVPSTPTGLTATAAGQTQIDLAWTDVSTGNTAQSIQRRSPAGSGSYSFIASVGATATSYSDTGLTVATQYEYQVAATNPATQSAWSTAANATTTGGGPPAASWTLDFSTGEPWANGTNYIFSSTASTSRTFVNSSGYVAPCVANLLQRSEEFTNAYWSVSNTTVANVSSPAAPDNSATADELKETATSSNHMIQRVGVNATAGVLTLSMYVKKQSRRYFGIGFNQTNTYFCIFDLDNSAAVTGTSSSGTPNGSNGSQDVGNGWYRIWITADTGGSGSVTLYPKMFLSDRATFTSPISDFAPSYTGSTSESVYIWGAQLVTGTAALPYSATTGSSNGIPRLTHNSSGSRLGLLVEGQRTNYATRFADINTGVTLLGIKAFGSGSIANDTTAPNNATEGDYLQETSGGTLHLAGLAGDRTAASGQNVCFSVYLKKAQRTHAQVRAYVGGVGSIYAVFNIDTGGSGTAGATGANITRVASGQEDVGNGWWRCWVAGNRTGSSNQWGMTIAPSNSNTPTINGDGNVEYSGNGTDGIYAWGAQLEEADRPSSAIPTTGTAVTRSADLAYVETADVTNWGRPGSFVVEYYEPLEQSGGVVVADDDGAGNAGRLGVEYSAGGPRIVYGTSGSGSGGTDTAGLNKIGWAWDGSGAATRSALNGSALDTSLATSFDPTLTDGINLGGNIDWSTLPLTVSGQPNVVIRKVQFYNSQLSAADLNTLTGPTSYNVEYLVQAGGAGGGGVAGGGAGGYRTASGFSLTAGTSYTITVGAGGAGATAGGDQGSDGSNSVFSTITSTGGGGGGGFSTTNQNGRSGGSGGGAGSSSTAPNYPAGTKGTGTSGQGKDGGDTVATGGNGFGGGGGASAAGSAGTPDNGAAGGAGTSSSITGSAVTRGGGGGGSGNLNRGTGGAGGGGNGRNLANSQPASAGTVNTGGGGGGGYNTVGQSGGSGVVIIRMATARYSGVHTPATVTTSGSDTILTFTSSGNYVA